MMRFFFCFLVLLPATSWWHPEPESVFDLRLQTPDGAIEQGVTVIELDLFDADADVVAGLEREEIRTICYFSVGTWEDWRPDADQFPPEVLGDSWDEWPGERYLDTRALETLMPIYEARLDLCAEKGFSGVDPDNIDSWWADTGFPLTQQDNEALIARLIDAAHERGLAIGQKNASGIAPTWASRFDFAVAESCAADGWCDEFMPYIDLGKPVYAIEYTDVTTPPQFKAMCARPDLDGFSLVYKHRDLDVWSDWCS